MATNKCVFKFALNEHTIKVFETNLFSILSCFLMGDYVEKHACIVHTMYNPDLVQPTCSESWHVCTLSKWNLLYLLHR